MQVSMDGSVKYAGHKVIKYKDGRVYASLSVVDDRNEPLNLFCPSNCINVLDGMTFGDDLQVIFDVNEYQNRLNLRVKEVVRYG